MVVAQEGMSASNNFKVTVTSGSKGDFFNIGQITSMLGQQFLNGRRIQPSLSNGRRTLCHYPPDMEASPSVYDDSLLFESRGFVQNSFMHGLNPREFFFHAMTGREGITDTAMKTATSGYIQRRMIKLTEDVQIQYDQSVRGVKRNVIQFLYGHSGLDPSMSAFVNGKECTTHVDRLAKRFNTQFENQQLKGRSTT